MKLTGNPLQTLAVGSLSISLTASATFEIFLFALIIFTSVKKWDEVHLGLCSIDGNVCYRWERRTRCIFVLITEHYFQSTWSAVITLNHVFLDLNDVVKMCWYMSYGEDFLGFFIFSKVKSASNQKSESFLRLYCSWNRGHNVIWGFDCIKSLDSTRLIQILSDTKFKIGGNLKTWKWDWVLRTV